jgi:uncharacterized protein YukE
VVDRGLMVNDEQRKQADHLIRRLKSEIDEAQACWKAHDLEGHTTTWAKAKQTMAEIESVMPTS